MRFRSSLFFMLAALVAALASTIPHRALSGAPLPRAIPAAQQQEPLVGTWDAVFVLDSVWQIDRQANRRRITGRVRFRPAASGAPTPSERSVYPGNFELEFEQFGFTLPSADAIGWRVLPDSVRVELNPAIGSGSVTLRGAADASAGTIAGVWRYSTNPGGATGRFTLRRVPDSD